MAKIEAAASDEHQKLVKALIDHFKSKGFGITCAAYEDYKECDKTGRHEPDARAYDSTNELVYIGEAKTCDDLSSQTTKEEFEDFSSRTMTGGKSKGKTVPFYIAIPSKCEKELLDALKDFGLSNKDNIYILKL